MFSQASTNASEQNQHLLFFRDKLLTDLGAYHAYNEDEEKFRICTQQFLTSTPDPLDPFQRRHTYGGHITSSMLIVNHARSRVLLNLHGLSIIWMNFGGHMDGDTDTFANACKEAREESGIAHPQCSGKIFDIDIHVITPHQRQGEYVPEHLHYDILYLGTVDDNVTFARSAESHDVRWFSLADARSMAEVEPDIGKRQQLLRLYNKLDAGWL